MPHVDGHIVRVARVEDGCEEVVRLRHADDELGWHVGERGDGGSLLLLPHVHADHPGTLRVDQVLDVRVVVDQALHVALEPVLELLGRVLHEVVLPPAGFDGLPHRSLVGVGRRVQLRVPEAEGEVDGGDQVVGGPLGAGRQGRHDACHVGRCHVRVLGDDLHGRVGSTVPPLASLHLRLRHGRFRLLEHLQDVGRHLPREALVPDLPLAGLEDVAVEDAAALVHDPLRDERVIGEQHHPELRAHVRFGEGRHGPHDAMQLPCHVVDEVVCEVLRIVRDAPSRLDNLPGLGLGVHEEAGIGQILVRLEGDLGRLEVGLCLRRGVGGVEHVRHLLAELAAELVDCPREDPVLHLVHESVVEARGVLEDDSGEFLG